MEPLDPDRIDAYFRAPSTVSTWWTPDEGPLAFHYDAELTVLEDNVPVEPDLAVLDVGTGRARFAVHYAGRGCRVTGVDLSKDMLESAREAVARCGLGDRIELVQGSASDLSRFEDGSFDLVSCMELFDHLPNLEDPLAEAHRVLKKDGRFVFTYVPKESVYGMIGDVYRAFIRRTGRADQIISQTYTLGEVRRRLAACGFELTQHFGVGVFCANAQTRLFTENPIARATTAIAKAEARVRPYHSSKWLARHGAHVVGIATRVGA